MSVLCHVTCQSCVMSHVNVVLGILTDVGWPSVYALLLLVDG